jgi:hypothetical protein
MVKAFSDPKLNVTKIISKFARQVKHPEID